jgi:hypothetical protein
MVLIFPNHNIIPSIAHVIFLLCKAIKIDMGYRSIDLCLCTGKGSNNNNPRLMAVETQNSSENIWRARGVIDDVLKCARKMSQIQGQSDGRYDVPSFFYFFLIHQSLPWASYLLFRRGI